MLWIVVSGCVHTSIDIENAETFGFNRLEISNFVLMCHILPPTELNLKTVLRAFICFTIALRKAFPPTKTSFSIHSLFTFYF